MAPEQTKDLARQLAEYQRTKRAAVKEWLQIAVSLCVLGGMIYGAAIFLSVRQEPAPTIVVGGGEDLANTLRDLRSTLSELDSTMTSVRIQIGITGAQVQSNTRQIRDLQQNQQLRQ